MNLTNEIVSADSLNLFFSTLTSSIILAVIIGLFIRSSWWLWR